MFTEKAKIQNAEIEEAKGALLWSDRKRTLFGLPLSFTKYTLTEDRFFIKSGFFTTKEDEVRLYRILDVELKRTLWQKMFGVGSVFVRSADKTLKDFEIKSVKQSAQVKELLSRNVEKQRDEKRVVNREMMFDDGDEFDTDDVESTEV